MNYKKYLLSTILLYSLTTIIYSQNNSVNKDSLLVYNTINKLFDGMREGDSAKVHSVFHNEIRMYTSYTSKTGRINLKEGKLGTFLIAIGASHAEFWDEKIGQVNIQIDGNLAQVWANYAFFAGEKFSHCGVDAFQLVKGDDNQWKIIHLIDTRRSENCDKFN
jgi:putative lumazine-binding protein